VQGRIPGTSTSYWTISQSQRSTKEEKSAKTQLIVCLKYPSGDSQSVSKYSKVLDQRLKNKIEFSKTWSLVG